MNDSSIVNEYIGPSKPSSCLLSDTPNVRFNTQIRNYSESLCAYLSQLISGGFNCIRRAGGSNDFSSSLAKGKCNCISNTLARLFSSFLIGSSLCIFSIDISSDN